MHWFALATIFIASVLGQAFAEVGSHVKKHGKHHKKHHGKHSHHGKHHHHHHGKHHHHHHKHDKLKGFDALAKTQGKQPQHVYDVLDAMGHHGSIHYWKEAAHTVPQEGDKVAAHSFSSPKASKTPGAPKKDSKEDLIVKKMKALEDKIAKKKAMKQGQILVNGPLPADFQERFVRAVALLTGTDKSQVKVDSARPEGHDGVMKVSFSASPAIVQAVEEGVSDPDSKLANGDLHSFLVAKDEDEVETQPAAAKESPSPIKEKPAAAKEPVEESSNEVAPVESKGIDIDTAMPYGDLEPFGREDTAQELTEDSIHESNAMVDQLERAEVAEEKRAVFRALTRLRGAAITSFDGVARSQTGNIDEYNKIHKWRNAHPLHHLADEESDISKWAFPDNADF